MQPVCDGQHGAVGEACPQRLLDEFVRLHVHGGRGLVQHQDAGGPQQGSGQAQQLSLTHAATAEGRGRGDHKLQTLVYDILPSTTAVFSYTVGSRKLSADEHFFFAGAETVVRLLQTTQIKQGVSFVAANKVYTSKK